jgi:hypothetical protein
LCFEKAIFEVDHRISENNPERKIETISASETVK